MKITYKTRAELVRFASVAAGLLMVQSAFSLAPDGDIYLFEALGWMCAVLAGLAFTAYGMFEGFPRSSNGPCLAGVLGCVVILLHINEVSGVLPSFLVIGTVVAVLLAYALIGCLKRHFVSLNRH